MTPKTNWQVSVVCIGGIDSSTWGPTITEVYLVESSVALPLSGCKSDQVPDTIPIDHTVSLADFVMKAELYSDPLHSAGSGLPARYSTIGCIVVQFLTCHHKIMNREPCHHHYGTNFERNYVVVASSVA